MKRIWSLLENRHNTSTADLGFSKTAIDIILRRGYRNTESILNFLRPSLFDMHSPFLFNDMDAITKRLKKAYWNKEKILIYGDYDVDGITSTALLFKVFKDFGFQVIVYIPDREEGYGLQCDIIKKAAENKVKLIITVDCGITAVEEVAYAAENGIEVIITDHHEPQNILPQAVGILDPKIVNSGYPFKDLAGVGVAFKLVQALYQVFASNPEQKFLESDYLDIVALGTIADVVPLVGENRIIVKFGLQKMACTIHTGLRALLEECGLLGKKLKAGQIAFIVAPRINAAGRMDTARLALNLFLEDNYDLALEIAKELGKENYQRQTVEKKILAEAEAQLAPESLPGVIVLSSPAWHHGVIGIVASRLVERYYRPVFLIAEEGEIGKGSARGIPGYHVLKELEKQAGLLSKFGGHKQAAGFTLPVKNIPQLKEALNNNIRDLSDSLFQKTVVIDSEIPSSDLDITLQRDLEQLAPFGIGNPAPLLLSKNLTVREVYTVGKEGKHLKLILETENKTFLEALAFYQGDKAKELKKDSKIDIIYCLEINDYFGEEKIQIIIKDYCLSENKTLIEIACAEEENNKECNIIKEFNDREKFKECCFRVDRGMLVEAYKELKKLAEKSNPFFWKPKMDNDLVLIKIFEELNLIKCLGGTGPYLLELNNVSKKIDLLLSLRYKVLSQIK